MRLRLILPYYRSLRFGGRYVPYESHAREVRGTPGRASQLYDHNVEKNEKIYTETLVDNQILSEVIVQVLERYSETKIKEEFDTDLVITLLESESNIPINEIQYICKIIQTLLKHFPELSEHFKETEIVFWAEEIEGGHAYPISILGKPAIIHIDNEIDTEWEEILSKIKDDYLKYTFEEYGISFGPLIEEDEREKVSEDDFEVSDKFRRLFDGSKGEYNAVKENKSKLRDIMETVGLKRKDQNDILYIMAFDYKENKRRNIWILAVISVARTLKNKGENITLNEIISIFKSQGIKIASMSVHEMMKEYNEDWFRKFDNIRDKK